VRFELVTKRAFTGIVEGDRVRIWPIGPSGGADGVWHQWRPVFNGVLTERRGSTHLTGDVILNRGVFVVVGMVVLVLAGWLLASAQWVVGALRGTSPMSPMVVLAGVVMPVLFIAVAAGIFWVSFQSYIVDRAELREFIDGLFVAPPDKPRIEPSVQ
jgi:hypothetical protein